MYIEHPHAVFNKNATTDTFAIAITRGAQIKLYLNNDKTKHTGIRSKFYVVISNKQSKAFFLEDAKAILGLIREVMSSNPKECKVKTTGGEWVYRLTQPEGVTSNSKYELTAPFKDGRFNILNDSPFGDLPDALGNGAIVSLFKLRDVLDYFVALEEGEEAPNPDTWIKLGKRTQYPLNTTPMGGVVHSYVMAVQQSYFEKNTWLIIVRGDKSLILYEMYDKEETSSLKDIANAYIKGLKEIQEGWLSKDKELGYSKTVRLENELTPDRADLMEYVRGKEVYVNDGDRKLVISMSSEGGVVSSKVNFTYTEALLEELITGLEFLTN